MKLKDVKLINPIHLRLKSDGHGEFPDSYKLSKGGILLLQEFGKQCFEAGKKTKNVQGLNPYGDITYINIPSYPTFEDYLKSLEDE